MRVVSYRTDEGVKTAIVEEIRAGKFRLLIMGAAQKDGLGVVTVDGSEARYMADLERNGKPYPLRRALTTFARYGRTHSATKAAKQFIKRARA